MSGEAEKELRELVDHLNLVVADNRERGYAGGFSNGDILHIVRRLEAVLAEMPSAAPQVPKSATGGYSCHITPDPADIEKNKKAEPHGERLRAELQDWLERNGIVSIMLDTNHHVVRVDIAPKLPPEIRPVLGLWGSIFVTKEAVDAERIKAEGDAPTQKGGATMPDVQRPILQDSGEHGAESKSTSAALLGEQEDYWEGQSMSDEEIAKVAGVVGEQERARKVYDSAFSVWEGQGYPDGKFRDYLIERIAAALAASRKQAIEEERDLINEIEREHCSCGAQAEHRGRHNWEYCAIHERCDKLRALAEQGEK
jgi:hypothetical protein